MVDNAVRLDILQHALDLLDIAFLVVLNTTVVRRVVLVELCHSHKQLGRFKPLLTKHPEDIGACAVYWGGVVAEEPLTPPLPALVEVLGNVLGKRVDVDQAGEVPCGILPLGLWRARLNLMHLRQALVLACLVAVTRPQVGVIQVRRAFVDTGVLFAARVRLDPQVAVRLLVHDVAICVGAGYTGAVLHRAAEQQG